MLGIPQASPYDINLKLLGIPIRISPFFWIVTLALGWGDGEPQGILTWVGCVTFSIIVHEMGHALTNRFFGRNPAIVLHGMGGLCFSEGGYLAPWKRILVLFNGPMAGFLIYGLILAITSQTEVRSSLWIEILNNLIFINFFWGIVNLIPIWPLDGGQIMGVILQKISLRRGQELTHGFSLVVASLGAIYLYQSTQDIYPTFLLGLFAFNNFQMLQIMNNRHIHIDDSEEEWWRR
jgi:Zn-dependent protease